MKNYNKTKLACYLGFITQAISAKYVDRIGYRVSIVTAEMCSAVGLTGLAVLPDLLPSPFMGIMISVIVPAVNIYNFAACPIELLVEDGKGPGIVGRVAQDAGGNISTGMRVGLVFPVILVVMLLIFKRLSKIPHSNGGV